MTILSAQTISLREPLMPVLERAYFLGLSYGLGAASYDVRCDQDLILWPGRFVLASTMEYFRLPNDLAAVVHDKSTWARRGVCVQNTFIDPGFHGFLTLEITNHYHWFRRIKKGMAIAQIVFHQLDVETESPYQGRYQNQARGPQPPILAKDDAK